MSKWQTRTLGQISQMCLGKMLDEKKNKGKPQPYLANINVRWGRFDLSSLNEMRFEDSEQDRYGLKFGDLVVCEGGEPGRCALWKDQVPGMRIQKALHRVRINSDHNNEFSYYRLLLAGKRGELAKYFIGSTIKHLTGIGLKQVAFEFPTLKAQQKIAAVLSALDAKIDCNNRINAELEAMAKALYDYWFVQFDFPDANGKPYKSSGGKMVYNSTLKREIPAGWSDDALSNVTSLIRRGLSPTYVELGGTSVLNQKCIRDQKIIFLEARRHAAVIEAKDDRLLQHLDVLINSTGVGTLGRVAFVKRLNEKYTTVDSHVTIVRANIKRIHPDYLTWTMLRFQPAIEAAANGSTGQVELSKSFLEELKIVVPNATLQSRFSAFVSPLAKVMAAKEKEVEHLTQLRDWLLPLLMNGQVTVA